MSSQPDPRPHRESPTMSTDIQAKTHATSQSARAQESALSRLREILRDPEVSRLLMLFVALAGLVLVFSLASNGRELRPVNLINIATSGSLLGIVAIGQVIVMIGGGLDLSVGSTAGLVSSATAVMMSHTGQNAVLGVIAGLLVGALAGAVNAFIIAVLGINSVIGTLATYSAYAGIALLITGGREIGIFSDFFNTVGVGSWAGLPYLVWVLIVVCIAGWVGMRYTTLGRRVYAIGGSERTARLAGIPTRRYLAGLFLVSGLCAGIAGVLLAALTAAAQPSEGSAGLELTAVTAVLLGGTGLSGGRGSVMGAILGVALLSTLNNGLLLVGLQQFWQQVATGVLLVLAVALQDYRELGERLGIRLRTPVSGP